MDLFNRISRTVFNRAALSMPLAGFIKDSDTVHVARDILRENHVYNAEDLISIVVSELKKRPKQVYSLDFHQGLLSSSEAYELIGGKGDFFTIVKSKLNPELAQQVTRAEQKIKQERYPYRPQTSLERRYELLRELNRVTVYAA